MYKRNPLRSIRIPLFVLALAAALALYAIGCDGVGDDDDSLFGDDDDGRGDDDGDDDSWDDDDAADDDDDSDDDDDIEPPEPEEDVDPGTRPRFCNGAVYVLNTEDDFVSSIDAQTLAVDTIEVERRPEILRATENCSALVTLNTGADSVSIIDTTDHGVSSVGVRPDLNEMKTAPGSRYALAYHHFQGQGDGPKGYGEISIVDIQEKSVSSLAVGFPPDSVVFTTDNRALLVSEITLALVNLANGAFTELPTGLNIEEGQKLKKVAVTSDGDYALLLAEASTILLVLDLASESLQEIELGCYPTDLDVAESGNIAILLCREEGKINVLDTETLLFDQIDTDEVVGSGELASDGQLAILFTNSLPIERVHLFYPATSVLEIHLTVKPLIGAAIAPTDRGAVLFHFGGDGDPIDDFDEYFDTREAFSIMNLTDGRINPVEVSQTPTLVSFGDGGRYGVIPLPECRQVVLVDLITGLADVIVTPSTPIEVGVISDLNSVFVLQEHPLGRISFIDTQTLDMRTITGFLLNGQIEE